MVEVAFKLYFLYPQISMNALAIKQDLVLQTLFAKTLKAATTVNAILGIKRILQMKTSARVC